MSKGILFFAYNNNEIDYVSMAMVNALFVKKHFTDPNISIVTDEGSYEYTKYIFGEDLFNRAFDKVIFDQLPRINNSRSIRDSYYTEKTLPWKNTNRVRAYNLTPYNETLVLDVDYLVQNNILEQVFGNSEEFLMNNTVIPLLRTQPFLNSEYRLSSSGIRQYWATAFYFRKGKFSERIFDLTNHIFDNYDYYRIIYGLKGKTIRNDYIFSIALHEISGFFGAEIKNLPIPYILSSPDFDVLWQVRNEELFFLSAKPDIVEEFIMTKSQNVNIHIMNKQSFIRNIPELLKGFENV